MKHPNMLPIVALTVCRTVVLCGSVVAQEPSLNLALQPPSVITSPWPQHVPPTTRQGVPGIERTANGRLWAIWGTVATLLPLANLYFMVVKPA